MPRPLRKVADKADKNTNTVLDKGVGPAFFRPSGVTIDLKKSFLGLNSFFTGQTSPKNVWRWLKLYPKGGPRCKKIRISMENQTRRKCLKLLQQAQNNGDLRMAKRIMTVLAVADGALYSVIASTLKVSEESIRLWVNLLLLKGINGLEPNKPSGRPSKLTKTQRKELDKLITEGPHKAGFPGACWRSPMIQFLIYEKFGVEYSVHYICQLLKNMGFSYQKAKFVADHKDPEKREEWLQTKWPEILKLAEQKNAFILFGDEASFPQWGSLTYTWAKKGQQPVVKTSGKRKGYKVFGLIDYFSGRFFCKGHD